jgi:predicted alpha/beta hydrolase family esterase
MSKKVLLLHGWGGSDYPHWQSWLASELAKDYGEVCFLRFSDFDFPQLDIWLKELENKLNTFKPDIVVCHSLANTLWFHLCKKMKPQNIEKLYLVAPPSFSCEIEELKSFFPLALPRKYYAINALLITSREDPYLTQDEAKELQASLGVEMMVLESAGHINADSNYGNWDWILKNIKEL